ncbi:hypothetical protein VE23_05330 [Paenibacillus sp. D9]|nr:hypothetical protein VE23_05330 [Paenibacillus sp. D9]
MPEGEAGTMTDKSADPNSLPEAGTDSELRSLTMQLEEAEHAEAMLAFNERRRDKLRQDIFAMERKIFELEDVSRKEHEDVEQLSRLGWSALWLKLTGGLEEQLELERQEAAEALFRLKEAKEQLDRLQTELSEVGVRLAEHIGPTRMLPVLKQKKEELVRLRLPQVKEELDRLDAELAGKTSLLAELREACSACSDLNGKLGQALSSFESASNWGTYDMLGGGMISTHIKHRRMDEAQEALGAARSAARRLESELKDLGREEAYRIPVGSGARLGDYLLDGFLMDWFVQSKIAASRESTRELLGETRALYRSLDGDRTRQESELSALQRKRERLILEAGRG